MSQGRELTDFAHFGKTLNISAANDSTFTVVFGLIFQCFQRFDGVQTVL